MKKMIPLIAALALLLTFSTAASAQGDELSAKNLYLSYGGAPRRGRPGVKITIELKRDGVRRTVPLNYAFRAGDKVKFHFETNFNAYVKIINIGSTGDPQLLYPYRGAAEYVARTKDYSVPQGDLWFEFDRNPGAEQLTFVFSSQPFLTPAKNQNRPNRPAESQNHEQHSLAGLSSASLENGKNLALVQDSQGNEHCAYGVATTQAVRKPIGVRINLRHQ
jgi:uncharacterized protein DUF4384